MFRWATINILLGVLKWGDTTIRISTNIHYHYLINVLDYSCMDWLSGLHSRFGDCQKKTKSCAVERLNEAILVYVEKEVASLSNDQIKSQNSMKNVVTLRSSYANKHQLLFRYRWKDKLIQLNRLMDAQIFIISFPIDQYVYTEKGNFVASLNDED